MYHDGRIPDPHAIPGPAVRLGPRIPNLLRRHNAPHPPAPPVAAVQPPPPPVRMPGFNEGFNQYYGQVAPDIAQQGPGGLPQFQLPVQQAQQVQVPALWNAYGAYPPPPYAAGAPQAPQPPVAAQVGQGNPYVDVTQAQLQLQQQQMQQQQRQRQQLAHQRARMQQLQNQQLLQQQQIQQQIQHQQQQLVQQQQQQQFHAYPAYQPGGGAMVQPQALNPLAGAMGIHDQALGQVGGLGDHHNQQGIQLQQGWPNTAMGAPRDQ